MKKNIQWFTIVLAFWIVFVIGLTTLYILEYILPFSRSVKGIENATISYYQTTSWVEDALFFINENDIWAEDVKVFSGVVDYSFSIVATGSVFPSPWYGTSDIDKDWSKIALWTPLQIYLPASIWSLWNFDMQLRVPDFIEGETLELTNSWALIHWQLSSTGNILNADATSRIEAWNICNSNETSCSSFNLSDMGGSWSGFLLDNSWATINDFYQANCWTDYKCILKMSVLQSFAGEQTTWVSWTGKIIPYLEYQIDFDSENIPKNIIEIDVSGKSYGFRKDMHVLYPQKSLIEAFDFTLFQ